MILPPPTKRAFKNNNSSDTDNKQSGKTMKKTHYKYATKLDKMHKQKTCVTSKIQLMQRAYPSETVKHMLIIKMQLISALLNGNFKRDSSTCLPYSRKQISALFLTLHTITKKNTLLFVLKQNMQLVKVCVFK